MKGNGVKGGKEAEKVEKEYFVKRREMKEVRTDKGEEGMEEKNGKMREEGREG